MLRQTMRILVVTALVASACGGSGDDGTNSANEATTTVADAQATTTTTSLRDDVRAWCLLAPDGLSDQEGLGYVGPSSSRFMPYWNDLSLVEASMPAIAEFDRARADLAPPEIATEAILVAKHTDEELAGLEAVAWDIGAWENERGELVGGPPETPQLMRAWDTLGSFERQFCGFRLGVATTTTQPDPVLARAADEDVVAYCTFEPTRVDVDPSVPESVEAGFTATVANALARAELAPPEIAEELALVAEDAQRFFDQLEGAGFVFDGLPPGAGEFSPEAQAADDAIYEFEVAYCGREDDRS